MRLKESDIVIVGCGISCISMILRLIKSEYSHKIVVLECGRTIDERVCSIDDGGCCNDCSPCNSISGFGGAVSIGAPLKISSFPSGKRIAQILSLESIEKYTTEALALFDMTHDDFIMPVVSGFPYPVRSYPLTVLNSDKVSALFIKWINIINKAGNVQIYYNAQVETIKHEAGRFTITYDQSNQTGELTGQNLVLAYGRKGVFQFTPILENVGVKYSRPVISIGFRFMCPNYFLEGARNDHPDFKTSITYKGLKYKTFCFSAGVSGGIVKTLNYGDFSLVDGHIASVNKKSNHSNFALLTHIISEGGFASLEQIKKTVLKKYVKLNKKRNGIPVYQSYLDFKSRIASQSKVCPISSILPHEYDYADLSSLLTIEQHEGFCHVFEELLSSFIAKYKLCIELSNALSEVYMVGLELEGFWNDIELDSNFQSNVKGLYFIGDCTGRAHGVMAASVSGIALGAHLSSKYKDT